MKKLISAIVAVLVAAGGCSLSLYSGKKAAEKTETTTTSTTVTTITTTASTTTTTKPEHDYLVNKEYSSEEELIIAMAKQVAEEELNWLAFEQTFVKEDKQILLAIANLMADSKKIDSKTNEVLTEWISKSENSTDEILSIVVKNSSCENYWLLALMTTSKNAHDKTKEALSKRVDSEKEETLKEIEKKELEKIPTTKSEETTVATTTVASETTTGVKAANTK